MAGKADKNKGKLESYEDDGFYKELERQIVQLIDNSEEVKPRTTVSLSGAREAKVAVTGKSRLLQRRNYYDWSVCGRNTAPAVPSYHRAASFAGTGVFIPQAVNFKMDYKKQYQ